VPFYFLATTDLQVIKQGTTPVTLAITTNYTVSGAGVEAGGSITLTGIGVSVSDVITIKRNMALTQPIDLVVNDRLPSITLERMSDRSTMQIQQVSEIASRSLRFEDGETTDGTLVKTARSSKVLSFDENGDISFITPEGVLYTPGDSLAANSIASLKAISVSGLTNNQEVSVLGYYAAGDGGGGTFYYDSASVEADNGGTVIQPTTGTGRWKRVYSGALNVRWFGAKGDEVTNDSSAIQNAASVSYNNGGKLFIPSGTFSCNVVFSSDRVCIYGDVVSSKLKQFDRNLPILSYEGINGSGLVFGAIDGIYFVGRSDYQSNSKDVAIYINGYIHGPITNCFFYRFNTAIYSNSSEYHKIDKCFFTSCSCCIALVCYASDLFGKAPKFIQHPTASSITHCTFTFFNICLYVDAEYWKYLGHNDCGLTTFFSKNDCLYGQCVIVGRNLTKVPYLPLVYDSCWNEGIGGSSFTWNGASFDSYCFDVSGGSVDFRSSNIYGSYKFTDGCFVNFFGCNIVGPSDGLNMTLSDVSDFNVYGLNVDSLDKGFCIWWGICHDVYDYRIASQLQNNPRSVLCLVRSASVVSAGNGLANLIPLAGVTCGPYFGGTSATVTKPTVSGRYDIYQLNFLADVTELFLIIPNQATKYVCVTFSARCLSGNPNLTLFGCSFSGASIRFNNNWKQYSFVWNYSLSSEYFRFRNVGAGVFQLANICAVPFDSYDAARAFSCSPSYIPGS
jgi:hypothetical protein